MSKFKVQPPLEYRPVFVQFIKRQKCRYNPSFTRFNILPSHLKIDVTERWANKHPGKRMPDLELSLPPATKARKRKA